jgi:hypothetical protein
MTALRRPRGTPEQAQADIKAAIGRLAKGRPERTDGKVTATNLAAEAGMSRKQLYHYLGESPALAAAWQQLTDGRKRPRPENSDAAANGRIRVLEKEVEAWKAVAAIARAEAERRAETNASLQAENDRLRAVNRSNNASVVALPPPHSVT